MEIEEIIGFDALYKSMCKCRKGVSWKDSVASFTLNAPERLMKIESELKEGTFKMRPPVLFTITSPKKREISSVCFRDRVYQRSLNDNVLYPTMTKSFIYDNWACQTGKGTDRARERLKSFLQRFCRKQNGSNNGYLAQFDIHGYYPNMNHQYIEDMFEAKLDRETFVRVREVLQTQYDGDIGYNPGSQMIQIAGISALNRLDHYIKEELHIKYYIRYMDDFLLIHEDKEYLKQCQVKIQEFLREGNFTLNSEKTKVFSLSETILFLGFEYHVTSTGKVFMLVNPKNVKAERRKLRRLVAKSKRGEVSRESVDESYRSWKDHASKGKHYRLFQKMDKFYADLWEGDKSVKDC